MKARKAFLLVSAIAAVLITSATPLTAATYPVITLDEGGSGTYGMGGTGPVPLVLLGLPGTIAPEPLSGLQALQYSITLTTLNPGDVLLVDPGTGAPTDLIRFEGQNQVYFFSLIQPGEQPPYSLADVPELPPADPGATIDENLGPTWAGRRGFLYVPTPSQPGFDPANPGITFAFLENVPEPRAALLALTGVLAVVGLKLRKRSNLSAGGPVSS